MGTELNSVPGSREGYAGLFKPCYVLITGNQQQVGAAYGKQAVGDHARYLVELLLQFHRVDDGKVVHVQDDVAVVRDDVFSQYTGWPPSFTISRAT